MAIRLSLALICRCSPLLNAIPFGAL
ncbi:hypothetical protein YPPY13_1182, partial [Yersinia pestis PY-13]